MEARTLGLLSASNEVLPEGTLIMTETATTETKPKRTWAPVSVYVKAALCFIIRCRTDKVWKAIQVIEKARSQDQTGQKQTPSEWFTHVLKNMEDATNFLRDTDRGYNLEKRHCRKFLRTDDIVAIQGIPAKMLDNMGSSTRMGDTVIQVIKENGDFSDFTAVIDRLVDRLDKSQDTEAS